MFFQVDEKIQSKRRTISESGQSTVAENIEVDIIDFESEFDEDDENTDDIDEQKT